MALFKIISRLFLIIFLIGNTNISLASVASIDFFKFESFKETIQSNIIKKNNLSEINSADLDFVRANEKQLNIIRNEIRFSSFNEEKFLNSYNQLNNLFTEISFDIYQESKFYLITNNVLTPGLDTKLRRISANIINQFYGLSPISVSIPAEKSKYLPIESPSLTAAEAVPAVGLTGATIVSVLGLGAAASGGGGGSGGSIQIPSITLSSDKTEIYDSDSSGITITVTADQTSQSIITVNLESTGTATHGVDFTGPTSISIPAGNLSSSASYSAIADNDYEGTETVIVGISSVINGTESGTQSITINLREYLLNLNSPDFVYNSGTLKNTDFAGITEYENLSIVGTTWMNPYGVHNIDKAWAYYDAANNKYLSGAGETIYIVDGSFDKNHVEFKAKADAGDLTEFIGSGRSSLGGDSDSSFHGNAVASLAAGIKDDTTNSLGMMGVAYNAKMRWAAYGEPSNTANFWADWRTEIANDAASVQPAAMNNSWGVSLTQFGCNNSVNAGTFDWCVANGLINASDTWPTTSVNIDDFEAYQAGFTLTKDETFALMVNGSVSTASQDSFTGWIDALNTLQNSTIIIYALSNVSSETEPGVYSALPYFYTQLEEAFLGVGWAEVRGTGISSSTVNRFGNPCGKAMKNCIFAAGGPNLQTAKWYDGTTSHYEDRGIFGGSSYSSPIVAGAIALLAEAFPNHTPAALQERILVTANNSFFTPTAQATFTNGIQHGYNAEWGHGLLDVDRALKPVLSSYNGLGGTLAIFVNENLNGGTWHSLDYSYLSMSNSFGTLDILKKLSNEYTFAYDALYGGFPVKTSDLFSFSSNDYNIHNLISYEIANIELPLKDFNSENYNPRNLLSFSYANQNKNILKFGLIIDDQNLAIQHFNHLEKNILNTNKNPFINNNKGGLGFSAEMRLHNAHLRFGFQDSDIRSSVYKEGDDDISSKTTTLSYSKKGTFFDNITLLAGSMVERGSILDSKGNGALGFYDSNSYSNFIGVNLKKNLKNNLSIKFSSTAGITSIDDPQRSLIQSVDQIKSSSFSLSIERKNITKNDLLLFSISQPHRLETGSMNIAIPNLADHHGNISHRVSKLDLVPADRQLDLGISYTKRFNDNFIGSVKNITSKNMRNNSKNSINSLLMISGSLEF